MKTLSIKSYLPSRKRTKEHLKDVGVRVKEWPQKPFEFPYGFLCGQIFIKEQDLLDEADYERMVDASNPTEAFKVLNDTDLADDLSGKDYEDYEQVIADDLGDLRDFFRSYLDDSKLIQFLFLRYDIANMKVIAKAAFTDIPLDKSLLYECSLYDPERLARYLREDFDEPKKEDNAYLVELAERLKKDKDKLSPHRIDIIADRYHYRFLQRLTFRIGSGFLKEYLTFEIDIVNIFNVVRSFEMEMDIEDLISQLVSGGKIKKSKLVKIIEKEPDLDDLEKELVEKWNKNWPAEKMEEIQDPQACEDILYEKELHFIVESKRTGCGLGLVLGYFLEKKKAYRRIRQIMKAKIDGIPPHEIKETVI